MEMILSQPLNLVLRDSYPPHCHSFERMDVQALTAAQTAIPPTPAGAHRPTPHHEVMVRISRRLDMCFCFSHTQQTAVAELRALFPGSPAALDWTSFSPQPSSAISQPLQFAQKGHQHLHGQSEPARKGEDPLTPCCCRYNPVKAKTWQKQRLGKQKGKGAFSTVTAGPTQHLNRS